MPSFASRRARLLAPALVAGGLGLACSEGAPGAEPEVVYVTAGAAGEASAGRGGATAAKGGGGGATQQGGAAGQTAGAAGTDSSGAGGSGGSGGTAGTSGGAGKGGSAGKSGSAGSGGVATSTGSGISCDDPIVMVPGAGTDVFVGSGKATTTPSDVLFCSSPGPRAYLKVKLPAGNWITDLDGDGSAAATTALAVRAVCPELASELACVEKAAFTNANVGIATTSDVYVIVQGAELAQGFTLKIARGAQDCATCGDLACSPQDVCVECNEETDCEQGVCDPALAYCRSCTGAAECAGSQRGTLCDTKTGACGCGGDEDCKNVAQGTCVKGTCYSCAPGTIDCNGVVGDGCEIDPRVDADNCGACGKTCNGAACVDGVCGPAPEVFADDPARPDALTANADALFYARVNDAAFPATLEIVRRPFAGGPEKVLQGFPGGRSMGLAVSATTVVAQVAIEESEPAPKTVTTIWSFAAAGGGSPISVASFEVPSLISEQPMLLDDTHVYWSAKRKNLEVSDTYRAPLAGGTAAELFEKDADLLGLTKTQILLGYHTENYLRNALRVRPLAGGAPVEILKDEEIGAVVADETHAYFTWSTEASFSLDCVTIWRLPLAGGKPTKVTATSPSGACATTLRLTETHLYADVGPRVLKAPKAGGPSVGVFDDPLAVDPFAVGPDHVYWATGTFPFSVKRVAR